MKTAEQILQAMIGQLFFQLATVMAENEQLKAQVAAPRTPRGARAPS